MKILGIDPGSIALGFGVISISGSKIIPVEYGVIKVSQSDPLHIRLCSIFDEIKKVIEKNKPDLICMETAFFGKNAASSFVLGHARGVITLAIGQSGIDFQEFAPTQIKKSATGNGNAKKEQVEYMIRTILALPDDKIRNDAFDALACAVCGYNHYNSFTQTKQRK